MSDEGEGAELARELFDHADCRLLLLERDSVQDVHPSRRAGGRRPLPATSSTTVRFLAGEERAAKVKGHLAGLRAGLYADDLDRSPHRT